MATIGLTTPLVELAGVGPRFVRQLTRLGLRTVRDLLWHFPSRYEDFSELYAIADLEPGQQATIRGTIEDVKVRRTWRKRLTIVEAWIADETGSVRAVWFNQPYLVNTLRVGRLVNISGKVSVGDNELYLSHPTYEFMEPRRQTGVGAPTKVSVETRHTGRLVPIYPETYGLTSKGIRFLVQPILKNLARVSEWIPAPILKENSFPEVNTALKNIHFPTTIDDADSAKKRFAFEDLFLLQLWNLTQKLKLAKERAPAIETNLERLKALIRALPFELTLTQKRSLWEIVQDIGKPRPMNRLLQGDVGSGKTVVATLAALIAAESGFQTAFMAPTEVLARQHFGTLKKLFSHFSKTHGASFEVPPVGFLTAGGAIAFFGDNLEEKTPKARLLEAVKSGRIRIVIGTHALISTKGGSGDGGQKLIAFKNLGLVIVDEQHRFGVAQRANLAKQETALTPHFLSMSATPIPRTLMLTVFGDLDISTITELPTGRKGIVTKIVPPEERETTYNFIREEVRRGRQAFVICPRIEPSNTARLGDAFQGEALGGSPSMVPAGAGSASREAAGARRRSERTAVLREMRRLELKSVKEEYEKLSKKVFPDLAVGMLHGQMPASSRRGLASGSPRFRSSEAGGKPTKESVMNEFRAGAIDVLVSTSVIEVGVDVPNASIMMIEGSDRFGLAQLYQFRGRVGRGEHQSYCFLFTDSNAKTTNARLKAIIKAKNGFELAEMDLNIRGPGQFFGDVQTGLPDVAMQALQNVELVKKSRGAAVKLLTEDPGLKRYPLVREKLSRFREAVHFE